MADLESGVLVALQGRISVDLGLRYREQLVFVNIEWPSHRVQHFGRSAGSEDAEQAIFP